LAFACVRCHAPNGVGGVPNRLNVGGDDTIPALNNAFRDPSEQFHTALQITQVMSQGSIVSKKPGVINMPSWTGVANDAQASAIAAYILAGFPQVSGVAYDANPATAADIYSAYACIDCHGQVGANASPAPAPNPLSPDKAVPLLRNPDDNVTLAEFATTIMEGSIPPPGKPTELLMPAWGQIMSSQQVARILPYIPDGPKGTALPAPAAASPLPLASGAASPAAGGSPATSSSP
jgi:mono/diheme cytochrome c family protein